MQHVVMLVVQGLVLGDFYHQDIAPLYVCTLVCMILQVHCMCTVGRSRTNCLYTSSLIFAPFLHDGSGDTPVCGEQLQGELTQCPFEVFPGPTPTFAPSSANLPPVIDLHGVGMVSAHTASSHDTALRFAPLDPQWEAMSSVRSVAHFDQAYVFMVFWPDQNEQVKVCCSLPAAEGLR